MEEVGKVIETQGNRAIVKITRKSACKNCQHSCGLAGDKHEIDELEVEVDNPIGAKKGDRVSLEMEDKQVFFASLTIYLIPPIFMILGYFIFAELGETILGWEDELVGILGAFIMFFLSFLGLRQLDNILSKKSGFDPAIIKIIESRSSGENDHFSL